MVCGEAHGAGSALEMSKQVKVPKIYMGLRALLSSSCVKLKV